MKRSSSASNAKRSVKRQQDAPIKSLASDVEAIKATKIAQQHSSVPTAVDHMPPAPANAHHSNHRQSQLHQPKKPLNKATTTATAITTRATNIQ